MHILSFSTIIQFHNLMLNFALGLNPSGLNVWPFAACQQRHGPNPNPNPSHNLNPKPNRVFVYRISFDTKFVCQVVSTMFLDAGSDFACFCPSLVSSFSFSSCLGFGLSFGQSWQTKNVLHIYVGHHDPHLISVTRRYLYGKHCLAIDISIRRPNESKCK